MNIETDDYSQKLAAALNIRLMWLETSELPKLKTEFRTFQTSFSTLYTYLIKKGLVSEDPYKHEAKMGEIQIPETRFFNEAEKKEELTKRLANYDNQLDFLVNFYQFNMELLSLERVRRMQSLVGYIDWLHLSVDAEDINTRTMAEITAKAKVGGGVAALGIVNGSLTNLLNASLSINEYLFNISRYNLEVYKLEIRRTVMANIQAPRSLAQIKKQFTISMPERIFYPELAEDVLKEDYSPDGSTLQEQVLESLKVPDEKFKPVTAAVEVKTFLIDGLQIIGNITTTLSEIQAKIDENSKVIEDKKVSFWARVWQIFLEMMNLSDGSGGSIYEIEYFDTVSGNKVRESLNFRGFMSGFEELIGVLAAVAPHNVIAPRFVSTEEPQLAKILDKYIRDTQLCYKRLDALDNYFKSHIESEIATRVKGIKPELTIIKNALVRANQQSSEYQNQKEEAEQLKRLGIELGAETVQ
jgi:hypothetical protein